MGEGRLYHLQLEVPESINEVGAPHEIPLLEGVRDTLDGCIHLVQNPQLGQRLLATENKPLGGDKVLDGVKLAQDVLAGIPDLVAEPPVRMNNLDIEIYIPSARGVGNQGEVERIGAAFGNSLGECRFLVRCGLLDLGGSEVSGQQLVMKSLELDSTDDVEGVDDVAKRLAHLAAVGVANWGRGRQYHGGWHRGYLDIGLLNEWQNTSENGTWPCSLC